MTTSCIICVGRLEHCTTGAAVVSVGAVGAAVVVGVALVGNGVGGVVIVVGVALVGIGVVGAAVPGKNKRLS